MKTKRSNTIKYNRKSTGMLRPRGYKSKKFKGGALSFLKLNGKFSGGNITSDLKKLGVK